MLQSYGAAGNSLPLPLPAPSRSSQQLQTYLKIYILPICSLPPTLFKRKVHPDLICLRGDFNRESVTFSVANERFPVYFHHFLFPSCFPG
jgi:hypothetical protein